MRNGISSNDGPAFLSALCAIAILVPASCAEVICEGTYSSHLQGVARDEKGNLYWSFTRDLIKTDKDGRRLKHITVRSHHGDLAYHKGKLYVAVNFGKFNEEPGQADSWVYVYKAEDLSLVSKHKVPELVHGAGGMAVHDGKFMVVGGLPKGYKENYVYEYDAKLRFVRRHVLPSGYTLLGIQTASYGDGFWWFGCYGGKLLKADERMRLVGTYDFDGSVGIVPLGEGRYLIGRCFDKKRRGKALDARLDPKQGLRLVGSATPSAEK